MKKTVLTYGTFDLFHVGHVRLLKRLKALGDELIVGISSDSFNEQKGKSSFFFV
jgi:glycerol-3-phosphate cytidylyltransferase